MMKLPYQELKVWQKSMDLTKRMYEVTVIFPKEERYGLISQIRRAAVSIPSNIAEGSQRTSQKEFAHFITISKGSLAELHTQLLIAVSFGYIQESIFSEIAISIEEINKMLYSFYKTLTTAR